MNMRRLRMGLNTLLNIKKQGFFIPYRYADTFPAPETRELYPAVFDVFKSCEPAFEKFLGETDDYAKTFSEFGKDHPPAPRWEQDWFPRLDGAAAYKMVRDCKPANIIEVGSGHSTRFMVQAIKDGNLDTRFTAIDPAPRADISKLPITIHNDIVQNSRVEIFDQLGSGDILFIDSSHIAMPGSDVDFLFLNILPRLPSGVIVHIHDIFLPHDYPQSWEWRGYNEQQVVAPLLFSGYEVLFSSQYAARQMSEKVDALDIGKIRLPNGAFETSLWLQKK
ncbi:hypothetical protein A9Q83_15530 [Alphaproteobacteria bacterium 46_93_T64]|nr:hypothetical protein A9Q83_15530 [Alphaproteobacteria bacterium 46_93_T64]